MLVNETRIVAVANGDGKPQYLPLVWLKLLLRLRQLPDGAHSLVLIKTGDDCRWSVQSSGKVEG